MFESLQDVTQDCPKTSRRRRELFGILHVCCTHTSPRRPSTFPTTSTLHHKIISNLHTPRKCNKQPQTTTQSSDLPLQIIAALHSQTTTSTQGVQEGLIRRALFPWRAARKYLRRARWSVLDPSSPCVFWKGKKEMGVCTYLCYPVLRVMIGVLFLWIYLWSSLLCGRRIGSELD
jgi:hypothetical protein